MKRWACSKRQWNEFMTEFFTQLQNGVVFHKEAGARPYRLHIPCSLCVGSGHTPAWCLLGELVTISYVESQALFHKGFSWSFSCYIILMKWFVHSQGQGDLSRVTEAASDRAQPSDPMVALLFHIMLPLCRPQLLLAASKSKAA